MGKGKLLALLREYDGVFLYGQGVWTVGVHIGGRVVEHDGRAECQADAVDAAVAFLEALVAARQDA